MSIASESAPVRILVTGNAGAGKSTMAKQLGEALSLPVFGLDSIVWRPGWQVPPAHEIERELARLVARPRWVIDGVSRWIERHADLVIFLDVPRLHCLRRCAQRNWRYLFRSRPGLPDDCPEWRIIPTLLRIIWRFDREVRPAILARAASASSPGPVYWHVRCEAERVAAVSRLERSASVSSRHADSRQIVASKHPRRRPAP